MNLLWTGFALREAQLSDWKDIPVKRLTIPLFAPIFSFAFAEMAKLA
jgi:hypothetical protein